LVARTARTLADLSLASDCGAYLGAEDELLGRLGVSRPTLRQAAKIVESDRLISVRRGVRGGFYAERPNAADSIRALARYLRLNGATLGDVFVVTRAVAQEAGALAAHNATRDQRDRMAAFSAAIDDNDSKSDLIRAETELGRLLAEMSGNAAVQLFMEIGYTFGMSEQDRDFYATPADRAATRAMQRDLCAAVLSGDADMARVMMQRRSQMIAGWLDAARPGHGAA
jgi:GntR family transcriptional regulator, transcriptional repressor for pyruvate dehydrogenase complex